MTRKEREKEALRKKLVADIELARKDYVELSEKVSMMKGIIFYLDSELKKLSPGEVK